MLKKKLETIGQFRHKFVDLKNALDGNGTINYQTRTFTVRGNIKPTGDSETYDVEFMYYRYGKIKVWVYGLLSGEEKVYIPHNYCTDYQKNRVQLCLYLPKYAEYNKDLLLTKNILPWTYEWLHFYELYLITGIWYGNGHTFSKGVEND